MIFYQFYSIKTQIKFVFVPEVIIQVPEIEFLSSRVVQNNTKVT